MREANQRQAFANRLFLQNVGKRGSVLSVPMIDELPKPNGYLTVPLIIRELPIYIPPQRRSQIFLFPIVKVSTVIVTSISKFLLI